MIDFVWNWVPLFGIPPVVILDLYFWGSLHDPVENELLDNASQNELDFCVIVCSCWIFLRSHNFKRDGLLSNNIDLVYQQLILGNYWFRAELLVINCWFNGICGFGIKNGNLANGCSMGFGAGQNIWINPHFPVPDPWIQFSGPEALQDKSGACLHAPGVFFASN